jgi:multicomponent K+:H+ antiporter subunit D
LFLLTELIERGREPGADVLALTREAYEADEALEDGDAEVGLAVPATMGVLGLAFMGCALVVAGLPPLSGFVAKFAVLTAALNPAGLGPDGLISPRTWTLLTILILSGLTAVLSLTRAGVRALWASPDRAVPRIRLIEIAPVICLLILCAVQTLQAGPIMRYMRATAEAIHAPQEYIRATLAANASRTERGQ